MTTTVDRPRTAPSTPPPPSPARRFYLTLRGLWRRLTSMRTALVLLFLLALAAVPGSLLPQRPLNPTKVTQYLGTHGWWGRLLDHLGFYDVFGSVWFSAVYLLLAVSLVGCLVPRIRVYARALRTKPLPAPKNLARLPESDRFEVAGDVDTVTAQLTRQLGRRWRTVGRDDGPGRTVSAEKGYSREAGNLVFHVALLGALVSIAVGRLYGYEGSVLVQEGDGFCNVRLSYDTFRSGRAIDQSNLAPFCVDDVTKFTAKYLDTGEATEFRAAVTYSQGDTGTDQKAHTITVNHPLRLDGDRVYLIGHGFAPTVTVTWPDGTSTDATTDSFIPQNSTTFYSEGAFEFPRGENADGSHSHDLGLAGYFAPDPVLNTSGVVTSAGPTPNDPVLGLQAYVGDVGHTAEPRSVYSLDQTQIDTGKLKRVGMKDLQVGETMPLPDGTKVRFDGYKQWVSIQVSHDPAQGFLLVFAVLMVAGLIASLAVRRRRLWLRLRPADPVGDQDAATRTVVEVGGLARSDSGNFTDEFRAVVARLQSRPDPGGTGERADGPDGRKD